MMREIACTDIVGTHACTPSLVLNQSANHTWTRYLALVIFLKTNGTGDMVFLKHYRKDIWSK
jgi:hypothetical protein